ncbi:sulfatase [Shivajiella indica]|uniref:Sulfatase n=1 Tax=Shivajiella indica TaxID=872115 RepID=A0ABW5B8M8_9BACT
MEKNYYCLLILNILLLTFSCFPKEDALVKPNIIVFIVDDMGWQDSSVPFWSNTTEKNKLYYTPNMERLAAEGVKFTQAYAHAVCSPSRTSLMTGMNPARHKVTNWTLLKDVSQDHSDEILEFPDWNINGLQPVDSINHSVSATSLPKLLQENGYHTIHVGKAHWGAMGTPGEDPLNLGFDINIAGHAAGGLGSFLGEKNFGNKEPGTHTKPWGVPGLEKYHGDTVNLTDVLTKEAILALERAKEVEKPFYLYLSHYTVHIPLEPDHRFFKKYKEMGMEEPEARYASMVEGMDKSLGNIMNYLKNNDLDKNTIILFMSDNGGLSAEARGGRPHTHNSPLNSGKGSAYEGGIRVPMIVKWPGVVEGPRISSEYVIIDDFFPSILEMANVQNFQTIQEVDGVSFVPILKGKKLNSSDERALVWHYPNKWGPEGPGIGATSTIRMGDWKLVYWYKTGELELFNLADDIGESHNLASAHPQKVKEMATALGQYLRSVNADRPKFLLTGEPCPWPDEGFN